MNAPTPEQRAEWRADAERYRRSAYYAEHGRRYLALLDALDATEAALAEAKARNQWLGDAS